jgi:cyclic pyranopterin monophosphate synthase
MSELSHLDSDGRARMIDVGDKAVTARTATATGTLVTRPDVIELVRGDDLPKADVLATARIAGIQGAKRTSELIPLCHPIPLSSVKVDFALGSSEIRITATAKTTGQTGVEMEALTAVAIAGLTLHDMIKAVDPSATLTDVRLESKTGGKRGHWTRDGVIAPPTVRPGTAVVIVASTAGAAGTREDTTGPVIRDWLEAARASPPPTAHPRRPAPCSTKSCRASRSRSAHADSRTLRWPRSAAGSRESRTAPSS